MWAIRGIQNGFTSFFELGDCCPDASQVCDSSSQQAPTSSTSYSSSDSSVITLTQPAKWEKVDISSTSLKGVLSAQNQKEIYSYAHQGYIPVPTPALPPAPLTNSPSSESQMSLDERKKKKRKKKTKQTEDASDFHWNPDVSFDGNNTSAHNDAGVISDLTCLDKCGEWAYDGSNLCWCDATCYQNGDCCKDVEAECAVYP